MLIILSIIYGYLYNASNGNLLIVTIFHVIINTFGGLILASNVSLHPLYLSISYLIILILIVLQHGTKNLSKHEKIKWSTLLKDFQNKKSI